MTRAKRDRWAHSSTTPILWGSAKYDDDGPTLTTALLRISYDGCHFTGWSSANDDKSSSDENEKPRKDSFIIAPTSGRRRRKGLTVNTTRLGVRSVEGVLQRSLAKLYGDIDVDRVVVMGCSRTDKGVHALGMVAQIYAYASSPKETDLETSNVESLTPVTLPQPSIPGKRLPHPWHSFDPNPCFVPLPKPLPDLTLALNRMLYPEIQIMAYSAVPIASPDTPPFHPSLSARTKTYRYTLSVGPMHDPTQLRTVWHVHPSNAANATSWNMENVLQAAQLLQGHHNFSAFQGGPRGSCEKRRRVNQNTMCTMESIEVNRRKYDMWSHSKTFEIFITGDRFLYKMVRFIVGALVAVGTGKCSIAEIEQFLETGDRQGVTFECAPPHGLVLYSVQYDTPSLEWYVARSKK